jgi:tripartite-type tricarboxylate transporter receptor subunit TctC
MFDPTLEGTKSMRHSIWVTAILTILVSPLCLGAASYPSKPVHVIVVFPPGGSNDVTARIVFKKMEDNLEEQFVIDNRAGAAGTIGAAAVARSAPDGYTVMVQSTTHVANAYMYRGTLQDFIGVTPLARQVGVLVVHPSVPAKSVMELITLARTRPGEVNYGSAGLGSYVHLSMAMLQSMSKTKMTHIPYKGGGPLGVAVVSGEVATTIGTIGSFFPHIKTGQMRPLGVTSSKRVDKFPDIPAIAESLPGYEFTAWVGSFVPAGTPRSIVEKLNTELRKALNDSEVVKLLTTRVLDPMYMTPGEFAMRLKSDYDRYGRLMRQIGVI